MSDDESLFDDVGDPVNPGLEVPTSPRVVAALSPTDRALRVRNLTTQAHSIVDAALAEHLGGRELVATCVLFSGGNDSTTLAHMFRSRADYAVHANTTIGIEQTRQFVRDTCALWGLELLERTAPRRGAGAVTYRELCIERGFPGPAMHWKMYTRLKERPLMQVRRELVTKPSKQRILFLAGRRRSESERRADVPLSERNGSVIWASPLALWTKLDLATYRKLHPGIPRNEVSDLLHMSGECLCGAFAKPGELDQIGLWFPEVKAEIEALEAEVRAAGHPEEICRWGHGEGRRSKSGPLCTSCAVDPDQQELFSEVVSS
jgi:3'-phosphoadenosine 5'-phosphosulfate sulfotransferase (PAPS reductase)/FAD synthetase